MILAWRMESFMRLGYSDVDAEALAFCTDIDPHDVERLIKKGCPPDTAVQILA